MCGVLIVGAVLFHFLVRPSATSTYPIDETAGAASATRADELSPSPDPVAVVAPLEQVLRGDELPAMACEPDAFVTSSAAGGLRSRKQSSTGPSAAACQSIACAPRSTGDIKQQRNGGANAYR